MEIVDEILNIPFKPWEYMTYTTRRVVTVGRRAVRRSYGYDVTFETLKNYDRTEWKPGVVVKFGDGLLWPARKRWETWFLTGKEKETFLRRNRFKDPKIPIYARNQFGIILGRYRWIKHKYFKFYDYGSFVMMLTGDHVGHIRKYYTTSPYEKISYYPYTISNYNIKCEELFHGVEIGDDVLVFLENLLRKIAYAD